MKVMTIYPHQGIGDIRFGMSRADVERALGITPKRARHSHALRDNDLFLSLGLNVMYDERERCNSVGIGPGFDTDAEYNGYRLLSHPAREVREWARAQDPALDLTDGFTSKVLGLNMFADWIDEAGLDAHELRRPAQAFVVFRPDYYDGLVQSLHASLR